jgi:hypothetical protein
MQGIRPGTLETTTSSPVNDNRRHGIFVVPCSLALQTHYKTHVVHAFIAPARHRLHPTNSPAQKAHRPTSVPHLRPPPLTTRANNMAFLFRNKAKSHPELVKSTKEFTLRLSEDPKPNPKVCTLCFGNVLHG